MSVLSKALIRIRAMHVAIGQNPLGVDDHRDHITTSRTSWKPHERSLQAHMDIFETSLHLSDLDREATDSLTNFDKESLATVVLIIAPQLPVDIAAAPFLWP